jgi:hypothetical protein
LPRQITDVEEFKRLADSAELCKVVRRGDRVKLKLRTAKTLYTYITDPTTSEELLKGLKIETVEL